MPKWYEKSKRPPAPEAKHQGKFHDSWAVLKKDGTLFGGLKGPELYDRRGSAQGIATSMNRSWDCSDYKVIAVKVYY